VSQAFDGDKDMKGLLARMLQQMVKVKDDEQIQCNELKIDQMDVQELSIKLNELLMEKRYGIHP